MAIANARKDTIKSMIMKGVVGQKHNMSIRRRTEGDHGQEIDMKKTKLYNHDQKEEAQYQGRDEQG